MSINTSEVKRLLLFITGSSGNMRRASSKAYTLIINITEASAVALAKFGVSWFKSGCFSFLSKSFFRSRIYFFIFSDFSKDVSLTSHCSSTSNANWGKKLLKNNSSLSLPCSLKITDFDIFLKTWFPMFFVNILKRNFIPFLEPLRSLKVIKAGQCSFNLL